MNFKRSLLVFCLIICILFCVSSVAASDANATAIASDDINANEEILTADGENFDDVLAVDENDADTAIAKNDADDKSVLSVQNADGDVLSAGEKTVNVNIYKQTGTYCTDKKIYFKVTDAQTGKPIKLTGDDCINFDVYYNNKWFWFGDVHTNSDGVGVYKWSDSTNGDGTFKIKVTSITKNYDGFLVDESSKDTATAKVVVKPYNVKIIAKKLSVPYKSKKKFTVKVIGSDKKPIHDAVVNIKVFTGKKYDEKLLIIPSDSAEADYKVSKLSPGKHKVVLSLDYDIYSNNNGLYAKSVVSYITVAKTSKSKMSVTIKAKGLSATYKSAKKFSAKVVRTSNGKAVKGVPVNAIVYTGSSHKTIALKSNAKGNVVFSTGKLSVGTHKVVLKIKSNKNYAGKAKTTSIKIVKKKSSSESSSKSTGKLRTKITINECYRNNAAYYFHITLKDSKGKALANKNIQIKTLINIFGRTMSKTDSINTDSNGVAKGYVNAMLGGVTTFDVTFTFAGDKSYYSSSASKYLG